MSQKMLGEKFDQEQTSPNIVQHNFCLLFLFFIKFISSQMHLTFRSTLKNYDAEGSFRCICVDFYKYQYKKLLIQNLENPKLNLGNWNALNEKDISSQEVECKTKDWNISNILAIIIDLIKINDKNKDLHKLVANIANNKQNGTEDRSLRGHHLKIRIF